MNNIDIDSENYEGYKTLLSLKNDSFDSENKFISKKTQFLHDIVLLPGLLISFLVPTLICGNVLPLVNDLVKGIAVIIAGLTCISSMCLISDALDKSIQKIVRRNFMERYPDIDYDVDKKDLELSLSNYEELLKKKDMKKDNIISIYSTSTNNNTYENTKTNNKQKIKKLRR